MVIQRGETERERAQAATLGAFGVEFTSEKRKPSFRKGDGRDKGYSMEILPRRGDGLV